ncbi:unnamed protein product [Cyprideis torosa]|uniref:Uncharacterized protein n=1 Tax=Cyprideis torosa TaxID=163714 RepID=A0A7R8W3A8_9CRUS|nr:unnamed protein product [Cyprideis torosa]CAG0879454.1 unnamed protein product [Cyprideis torosa]
MWKSLRTKRRDSNEVSAYSVFNEGCTPIQGTFQAETFEKHLGMKGLVLGFYNCPADGTATVATPSSRIVDIESSAAFAAQFPL